MNFFSIQERSLFSIHYPTGVKLFTRLRLKLSHLNDYKFRHNFKDTIVPMCDCNFKDTIVPICDCGTETETTEHFFFRCPFFVTERQKLLMYMTKTSHRNLNEKYMIDVLLYGDDKFNERDNKEILLHGIDYIKSTKRFERPIIDHCLL